MAQALSYIFTFLDLLYYYTFFTSFFEKKYSNKIQFIGFITVGMLVLWCFPLIKINLLRHLVTFALLFIICRVLFNGTALHQFLLTLLAYGTNLMIDVIFLYGVPGLLHISYSQFVWRKLQYTVTVFIEKFVALFFAWILQFIWKNSPRLCIDKRWLFLFSLYPLTSLMCIFAIFYSFQDETDITLGVALFSFSLIVTNIATLYLMRYMGKQSYISKENILLHKQMEIQTNSIVSLEQNYRSQRQFVHEFRNQLQTIHGLLCQGRTANAINYIESLQDTQATRIFAVKSNHPIIDAILNQKYQESKEHNIDFQVKVNDLSSIQIGTNMLVVLLSNLLDNAIEACCCLSDHRIIECIILVESSIFISIRNTSPEVKIYDGHIPTTKLPKANHGYGLPSVKHILNELHAEFTFTYEEGWFQFVTEIPID